jgi:hypothetical protein
MDKFTEKLLGILEIRVFALSRSGHHAIIYWMASQCLGSTTFLNSCTLNENPYTSAQHKLLYSNHHFIQSDMHSRKNTLIYNYENYDIAQFKPGQLAQYVGENIIKHLLILRDPFNLCASRLRYGLTTEKTIKQFCDLWCSYALEFLLETEYLNPKITISYNKWIADYQYRANIARMIGLKFYDAFREVIPSDGFGSSSFDGLQYQNKAFSMKVLERWKTVSPHIFKLFNDRVYILSNKIFGPIINV